MKRIYTLGLLLCLAITMLGQQRVDKLIDDLNNPNSKRVLVVAHRGDWRNAPENSLQAFQNCIDMGVDMIELDLHMSKDSVLFLIHDNTLNRTTNGHGKVSDYTAAQLKQLRLRAGHGAVTRHQIPTFEEALILCKGKILINVDKGYEYFKEAYRLMEKTGTTRQVVIKSGHPADKVLSENGDVISKVIYMPIININADDAESRINEYAKIRPAAIECCFNKADDNAVKLLQLVQKNGSKVWINSLWPSLCGGHDDDRAVEENQPEEAWGWIIEHGATLIQTDRPAQLIHYLKHNHRH